MKKSMSFTIERVNKPSGVFLHNSFTVDFDNKTWVIGQSTGGDIYVTDSRRHPDEVYVLRIKDVFTAAMVARKLIQHNIPD